LVAVESVVILLGRVMRKPGFPDRAARVLIIVSGFIYLEPFHRGKAVGKVIIEALKEWGKAKGMKHFQLNVYSENESAIHACEKAGINTVWFSWNS